jgi:hypothetical protein
VAMPKTAMNEHSASQSREDEIGGPRKLAIMETIAITHRVHHPPDDQFGSCVLRPDPAHDLASLLSRKRIHLPDSPMSRADLDGTNSSKQK